MSAVHLPLHDAVKSGEAEQVREWLEGVGERSADVFVLDDGGMDALAWACRRGHGAFFAPPPPPPPGGGGGGV